MKNSELKSIYSTAQRSVVRTLGSIMLLALLAANLTAQVTPSGGSTDTPVMPGSAVTIGWTRLFEDAKVDILIWDANTSTTYVVARNVVAAAGEYQWIVPPNFPEGSRYRVVVEPTIQRYRRIMSPGWVTISAHAPKTENLAPYAFVTTDANPLLNDRQTSLTISAITVAPQPAREMARIQLNDDFQTLRILGLDGKTHLLRTLSEGERTVDIDVHDFAAGIYSVVLTSNTRANKAVLLHISP
jgi:hypothetical protein